MRVLIIDPDWVNALTMEMLLRKRGLNVQHVYSAEDGIIQARRHDYDLFITELVLPDGDAYDLIRSIREARSTIPILVCSLLCRTAQPVRDAQKCGATHFLWKPL